MRPPRVLVWILPDQLVDPHTTIEAAEAYTDPGRTRFVLVESQAWYTRLPYHKKRTALYLSAGRHFIKELGQQGYSAQVVKAATTKQGLQEALRRHRSRQLVTMASTEYGIRRWQMTRAESELGCPVEVVPNSMFLVERSNPYSVIAPGRRVVMENFYRAMRKELGLLLEPDGSPSGDAWNFDAENRKPLPDRVEPPRPVAFEPDSLTRQVLDEVERSGHGVGSLEGFDLAVTRTQARAAFADFLTHRLGDFGAYEDAMTSRSDVLFHSALSPQMNLGLLDPLAMCRAAEQEYRAGRAPINSVEGFIRQIVGWREFMYWQYQRQMPGLRSANAWNAQRPMPAFFWDGQTEMNCLKTVVERLLRAGYTHHIERLMLVCNFCLLAGVDPRAVADWFLTFYVDSHDWVVLPNVIGMGLNADGGLTATKPYIASASYINKMSDYCGGCRYQPDQRSGPDACPFNALYWNFLLENEKALRANPRLGPNVLGLRHLDARTRSDVRAAARQFLDGLTADGADFAGPADPEQPD